MGRYGGRRGYHSAPAIMGLLGGRPIWRYFGVLGLVIPIIIYMYYVLIEAWCLGYAYHYLTGGLHLGDDPSQYADKAGAFFNSFVGANQDGVGLNNWSSGVAMFWFITFGLNFVLVYRGVSKGIEWFCVRAMPLMGICALIVLVRVLTLPGNPDAPDQTVINGLGFMWNPAAKDPSLPWYASLMDSSVWLEAAGQIFFSLSVGFGIIINYASYVKPNDDVALSGLTAAATNEFFEVCLGGLITLPAAFVFLGAAGIGTAVGSTFALGFNTLPVVFEYMPYGSVFGFLWFFMLFLAAITSSLSMLQPAVAFLEEGLGVGRQVSIALLGLITALGSFFTLYFSAGLAALDTLDFWVGTALIFVLATVEVIIVAWLFGTTRAYEEVSHGALVRVPRIWKFVLKYVSPVFLLIIFGMFCYQALPGYVTKISAGGVPLYSIGLIATLIVFLLVLISIASARWDAEAAALQSSADAPRKPVSEVR